jgi:hypothetical protein
MIDYVKRQVGYEYNHLQYEESSVPLNVRVITIIHIHIDPFSDDDCEHVEDEDQVHSNDLFLPFFGPGDVLVGDPPEEQL